MSTWLMDTPLLKMLRPEKAKPLLYWCDANDASLFISAASLTHVAQGIDKLPTSQSQGAEGTGDRDRAGSAPPGAGRPALGPSSQARAHGGRWIGFGGR
jgi:hypothetical protein